MQDIERATSTELKETIGMPAPIEEQAIPDEEVKEEKTEESKTESVNSDIIDIKIASPKKTYRINGDNSRVIELNPSDINIVVRTKEVYDKLSTLAQRAGSLLADQEEATTEKGLKKIANALSDLDKEMRDLIDYLFDSKVSDILAGNMNMYSLVNGEFWFEHCIDVLSNLYENNFNAEFQKMKAKAHKYTDKYTG